MPKGAKSIVVPLIESLGYCCPWAFLRCHNALGQKKTGLIAARLGVNRKTVSRLKDAVRSGQFGCSHSETCLYARIRASGGWGELVASPPVSLLPAVPILPEPT